MNYHALFTFESECALFVFKWEKQLKIVYILLLQLEYTAQKCKKAGYTKKKMITIEKFKWFRIPNHTFHIWKFLIVVREHHKDYFTNIFPSLLWPYLKILQSHVLFECITQFICINIIGISFKDLLMTHELHNTLLRWYYLIILFD